MKLVSNFNDRFKEAFGGRSVTEFANEISEKYGGDTAKSRRQSPRKA